MIEFNMGLMSPWSEIDRILRNMKSMEVVVGSKIYGGDAMLSIDDDGHVVLGVIEPGVIPKSKMVKK